MISKPSAVASIGRLRRVSALALAAVTVLRVELVVRRLPIRDACAKFGVEFAGFGVEHRGVEALPAGVALRWWATEHVVRVWPWARPRPCFRQSLALGWQVRTLRPRLCLEVVTVDPFAAHAFLQLGGFRLDTGDATSFAVPA